MTAADVDNCICRRRGEDSWPAPPIVRLEDTDRCWPAGTKALTFIVTGCNYYCGPEW
jgi:hypothetical protein